MQRRRADQGVEPKDAVHVATALTAKVPLLNTFDNGLLKKTNTLGNDSAAAADRETELSGTNATLRGEETVTKKPGSEKQPPPPAEMSDQTFKRLVERLWNHAAEA